MNDIIQIDVDSLRDAVDAKDRFSLLRQAESEARNSYSGSMKFESRGDAEYLILRPYGSTTRKSCGRRSAETEKILENFLAGKARVDERIVGLRQQLEDRAPILRARGLGRVPLIAARIIRKLDKLGWLGTSLIVVGTNALYAYESQAAVRIKTGLLATGDVDVLYDARRRLAVSGGVNEKGLIGTLQSVDRSFERAENRTCTAVNKDGYTVDLIEPQDHSRIMRDGQASLSDHPDDLLATTTDSSRWLLNAPKFEATAFDERGLPLRIATIDPRAYAMRKQWIVENDRTREPSKQVRDGQQARIAATIAVKHLGLRFDDPALPCLPKSFQAFLDRWVDAAAASPSEWQRS